MIETQEQLKQKLFQYFREHQIIGTTMESNIQPNEQRIADYTHLLNNGYSLKQTTGGIKVVAPDGHKPFHWTSERLR